MQKRVALWIGVSYGLYDTHSSRSHHPAKAGLRRKFRDALWLHMYALMGCNMLSAVASSIPTVIYQHSVIVKVGRAPSYGPFQTVRIRDNC